MKVTVTFREIKNLGKWDDFCTLKGLNPWCMNEGLASADEEVTLTYDELVKLNMTQFDQVVRIDM